MSFWRKSLVHFLSLILFFSLLGAAYATSANVAFRQPDKVKAWLKQSNLYGHFVANTITQGQKSAGDQQTGTVSLSDSAVQQAAQTAFTADSIQSNVEKFLDANYAWLQGKTDKPSFAIDLTQAKQSFAEQVAQYTQTRLAALPVCTPAQLAQIQASGDLDPLSISCRPSYLTPQASADQVKTQIENSNDFLSNPVVTADNFSQASGQNKQPYYQQLSFAPTLYKIGGLVPLVAGVTAAISAALIIFLSARKRLGLRKVGVTLLLAGILLVVGKFVADFAMERAKMKIVNATTTGQLQEAITDFFHRAESQLVKVDFYFGLAFLLLGLGLLIYIYVTRGAAPGNPTLPETAQATSAPEAKEQAPPIPSTPKPSTPKPPRLIQ